MTHIYNIEGMTCTGCAATVKTRLLSHPDITSAEVSLENQSALVGMQRHITTQELQAVMGSGKYHISENKTGSNGSVKKEDPSWFATYKPLLLIFSFILVISLIVSFQNGVINWKLFMNSFMSGFFITFSFFKLLNLKGFAEAYTTYDLLAMRVPAYGFVYPFIEFALGISYLTAFAPFTTNMVTVVVMGFSSMGVIRSVLNKTQIQCACLGTVFNLPMSAVTIVEDVIMVAMAGMNLLLY